jgi:electron transfer flavoprotein beta subunit
MHIAVLISGVADPRLPLPGNLSIESLQAHLAHHATLSPFDEAALELALSMRDADPEAHVTALVVASETLARKVLGWRPDVLHRVDLTPIDHWNFDRVADTLSQALQTLTPQASLLMMGREFGDYDDGSIPAGLARRMNVPYAPLVLRVQRMHGVASALRQASGGLEHIVLPARSLLSVTNDPGNRLRHPLLKNVMTAKRATLQAWLAPPSASTSTLQITAIDAATEPVRQASCVRLEGSAKEKARAMAQVLLEEVQA